MRNTLSAIVITFLLALGAPSPARADNMDAFRQARRVFNAVNTATMKSLSTTQLSYRHYVYGEAMSRDLYAAAASKLGCTRQWGHVDVSKIDAERKSKQASLDELIAKENAALSEYGKANPGTQEADALLAKWLDAFSEVERAKDDLEGTVSALHAAISRAPFRRLLAMMTNGGANCGEHATMALIGMGLLKRMDLDGNIVELFRVTLSPPANPAWGDWASSGDHVFAAAFTKDGALIMIDTWAGSLLLLENVGKEGLVRNEIQELLKVKSRDLFDAYVRQVLMLDMHKIPPNPYVSKHSIMSFTLHDEIPSDEVTRLYDAAFGLLTDAERSSLKVDDPSKKRKMMD